MTWPIGQGLRSGDGEKGRWPGVEGVLFYLCPTEDAAEAYYHLAASSKNNGIKGNVM